MNTVLAVSFFFPLGPSFMCCLWQLWYQRVSGTCDFRNNVKY